MLLLSNGRHSLGSVILSVSLGGYYTAPSVRLTRQTSSPVHTPSNVLLSPCPPRFKTLSLWPSNSRTVRMSEPLSCRCVAKECPRVCRVTRLVKPASPTTVAFTHSLGLYLQRPAGGRERAAGRPAGCAVILPSVILPPP